MENKQLNYENNEAVIDMEEQKKQKRKTQPLFLVCAIIAIICAAAASYYACKSKNYTVKDFKQEVEQYRKEYDSENQKLFEEFKRDLQTAGKSDFARARANVGNTVSKFCNFKTCTHLVYTMARDKIKKTNKAQEYIASIISSDIMKPCGAGRAAVHDLTANFIHRLQENDNNFKAKCAAELVNLPSDSKDSAAAKAFIHDLEKFNEQTKNYFISSAFTAASAAVEAIFIRQTYAALIKLLGPVVLKVAGSAAAPLLDGPLPIGDVIAIIGFAWCAYDIYAVCKVMPQDMRKSLNAAISNYSRNIRAEALASAEKAMALSNESTQKIIDQLQ